MIVRYMGGLGNQLFQYAFGKACEKEYGIKVKYDTFSYVRDKKRVYELGAFNISLNSKLNVIYQLFVNILFYLKVNAAKIFVYEKKEFGYLKPQVNDYAKYFVGHWQSTKYFESVKQELSEEFVLKNVPPNINDLYKSIVENKQSVAVHVRRGDYVGLQGYVLQSMDYYTEAMNLVKQKIQNPVFYCFSDDIEWCKANFDNVSNNIHFIEENSTAEDFMLMRACHGFVISNSTYSWWPAYLSDSTIKIAPFKWFVDEQTNQDVNMALLIGFTCLG